MVISIPLPKLTGSPPSYDSVASTMPSAASLTNKNSRDALPVPHTSMCPLPSSRASITFRMSAGMTWFPPLVKIVTRPVQIDRHQRDDIHPVLLPVSLAHGRDRLFRDAVGGVGFLRVTVPQVGLAEGHRRVLRVGADGPDVDEFLDFEFSSRLHRVHAHEGIFVEVLAGVRTIGADATDRSGEVDDDVEWHASV